MPAVARRGWNVTPFGVGFDALHSNMVGKLMFLISVKPNQSESNQIKPVQTFSSGELGGGGWVRRAVIEGLKMGRFDQTLLNH